MRGSKGSKGSKREQAGRKGSKLGGTLAPTEVVGTPKHSITYHYPILAIGSERGVRGSKRGARRSKREQEGSKKE